MKKFKRGQTYGLLVISSGKVHPLKVVAVDRLHRALKASYKGGAVKEYIIEEGTHGYFVKPDNRTHCIITPDCIVDEETGKILDEQEQEQVQQKKIKQPAEQVNSTPNAQQLENLERYLQERMNQIYDKMGTEKPTEADKEIMNICRMLGYIK